MGRTRLLLCGSPWSRVLAAALPLLLTAVLTVAPARRAAAQAGNTHIVISEVLVQQDGTDRTRTYIEFANLGSAAFDFRNCWIYRRVDPTDSSSAGDLEVMIQIAGTGGTDAADASKLQPVPPGGVLLVEWKRPNTGGGGGAGTPAGPNVFVTGASPPGATLGDQDLQAQIAIALFAPQATAPPFATADLNFGGATMLAYWFTGLVTAANDQSPDSGGNLGMARAARLGLWQFGTSAPSAHDFVTTLRWPSPAAPAPAAIGRRASDYYLAKYGTQDLSNASRASDNLTIGRYGSPGQPNLQFAELIPGQTLPNSNSLAPHLARGTTATTAVGSPAAATHVAAVTAAGAVAVNFLNAATWTGWQYLGGPSVVRPALVDNPRTASRSLFVVDALTNQLFVNRFVAVGNNPAAFGLWQAIGGVVSSPPAAAVDATSGAEAVAFNDATGVTMVTVGQAGVFAAAKPLPGSAKLADVSIVSTPSGFVVLGYTAAGQLQLSVLAADGTPGALSNVGSALANRVVLPAVARFNPVAGQIEILQAGAAGALQLVHVKLGATRAGDTVSAAVNAGISTDAQPAIAVNTANGDLMVLARVSDTPIPAGEKYAALGGQARSAILRNAGAAFLASARIGRGLMPPGIAPDVFFNANANQYVQLLVGEDYQLYRNTVAP